MKAPCTKRKQKIKQNNAIYYFYITKKIDLGYNDFVG